MVCISTLCSKVWHGIGKMVILILKVVLRTQCGNVRIFPPLIFYVKSILENLKVLKLSFFAIFEIQKIVDLVNYSLQKVQKLI